MDLVTPSLRYLTTSIMMAGQTFTWQWIHNPASLSPNNHDGTFTDIGVMAGYALTAKDGHEQAGMGVAVGDYDCDGWLDIFKANFADDTCDLYHNNGDRKLLADVTFPGRNRGEYQ